MRGQGGEVMGFRRARPRRRARWPDEATGETDETEAGQGGGMPSKTEEAGRGIDDGEGTPRPLNHE